MSKSEMTTKHTQTDERLHTISGIVNKWYPLSDDEWIKDYEKYKKYSDILEKTRVAMGRRTWYNLSHWSALHCEIDKDGISSTNEF